MAGKFALTVLLAMSMSGWFASAHAAAKPAGVATVEYIAPKPLTLDQVARILRKGKPIKAKDIDSGGLQAGDRIEIINAEAVLAVRMLTTGQVIATRWHAESSQAKPDLVIEAQMPGAPRALLDFLAKAFKGVGQAASSSTNLLTGPDQNGEEYMLAASRGLEKALPNGFCPNLGGKSNEPLRFRVPGLAPYENSLTPGRRALLVAWRGGVEPYSIRLQDEKKAVLGEVSDIRGRCAIYLPPVNLVGGSISLILTDGNRTKIAAMDIDLDATAPPMPKPITEAKFPASVAALYYATWLTTQDNGRWTWEAIQRVAAMGCQSLAAREWLSRYSDMSHCPTP